MLAEFATDHLPLQCVGIFGFLCVVGFICLLALVLLKEHGISRAAKEAQDRPIDDEWRKTVYLKLSPEEQRYYDSFRNPKERAFYRQMQGKYTDKERETHRDYLRKNGWGDNP